MLILRMLLILYGPPGAGKNFVGEWFACKYGFYFYDADVELTDDMKQCLYHKKPFTQAMRDHFFEQVIVQMKKLQEQHSKLVVAQAISRQVNRDQLSQAFPHAQFIHVDAGEDIRLKRLAKRGDWVTPDWVGTLLSVQEPASRGHMHLDNSHDHHHLSSQIDAFLG